MSVANSLDQLQRQIARELIEGGFELTSFYYSGGFGDRGMLSIAAERADQVAEAPAPKDEDYPADLADTSDTSTYNFRGEIVGKANRTR